MDNPVASAAAVCRRLVANDGGDGGRDGDVGGGECVLDAGQDAGAGAALGRCACGCVADVWDENVECLGATSVDELQ